MGGTLLSGKRAKMRLNEHYIKVILPSDKPLSYEEGSKKIRALLKGLKK